MPDREVDLVLAEVRALTAEVRAERATVDAYRAEGAAWRAEVSAWREETQARFDTIDRGLQDLAQVLYDHVAGHNHQNGEADA